MGFAPDQIAMIGKMKADGQTWDDIAAVFGTKPDTVRMAYKRATGQSANRSPAPARARDKGRSGKANTPNKANTEPNTPERQELPVEIVTTLRVTRDMTIGQMAELLQMAKNGYERAAEQEDESKRTWQETSYMKIMKDVLVQMGKWCGLDDSVHDTDRRRTVSRDDVEGMTLDDMRELVRDL